MPNKQRKYIAILGSIMSGLGKGILTASICKLLQLKGYKVVPLKFDGYLNVDCGTMNPFRHGEVFVLDDGSEVDMDFGTYERFLNISMTKFSSITGGKIFQHLIQKEREGRFLGRDVQIVPHLTDELKDWIRRLGEEADADFVIIEVGGTVGDLENSYFIEAIRQLSYEEKYLMVIQLTRVPSLSKGEPKTKPTQHANRLIQSLGLRPDAIVCREDEPLTKEAIEKIAQFANIKPEFVYDDPTVGTIYELPIILNRQGIMQAISSRLDIDPTPPDLSSWCTLVNRITSPSNGAVKIALVGKYTSTRDAYASVYESIVHAAAHYDVKPLIDFIESAQLEESGPQQLSGYDGIIVPGGFGKRGIEGKISAISHARVNNIPYLGLCLGMQLMVVEYARNVLGWEDAHTTEIYPETKHPVIDLLPEQKTIYRKGGTMRLGAYTMQLVPGTVAHSYYGLELVDERHRHRYEVNPEFVRDFEEHGLVISGRHKDSGIVEMVEWPNGLGIGTQAHPEFKSRLEKPAPLFLFLIEKALQRRNNSKEYLCNAINNEENEQRAAK
ncbi:MAG: CTP synthase [Candidatus Micrarchaeota archaeon]|nr:CTP synthase [Candidatus Micrarchaeota archaeon]